MSTYSPISHSVMRRVHVIHAVRTHSSTVFAAIVAIFAVWGIGREVWVARVFENMPALTDLPAVFAFYASAFIATDIIVQSLSIAAGGAVVWVLYMLLRTKSSPSYAAI